MSARTVTGLSRNELLAHLQAAHVRTEKAADLILRLQAITAALAKARTPDQVAAVIVERGVQALEVPAAFVALLSDDGTGVKLAHAAGVPKEVHNRWRHFALSTPTAVTRAIRTGAPNFPATESQASGEDPLLADVQTHLPDSVWTVLPLGAGQRVIGALTFILSRWRWLVDDERSFALNVAQIGAQAFERARLQEREIRTWAESERLQKTLLNAIAHDLKTPLTTVQGCLDTLLIDDERLEPPTRRELLTIAHQGVRRFSRVVTGVLQMRRLETGAVQLRRESGILGEVVQNAVDEVASTPDRSRYNIDLPDNLPLIPMDTMLMSHVLINLLENAAKYSPPESRIDVGTHLENDSVVISVADQGTGSSPEQLNRVFESSGDPVEHFTTRAEGGGLGLIIAREFVEAHNGRIWATHREGGGMVVNVSIPLHGSHPSSSNAL
jgi:K+-sensing histidine kinase KdpD